MCFIVYREVGCDESFGFMIIIFRMINVINLVFDFVCNLGLVFFLDLDIRIFSIFDKILRIQILYFEFVEFYYLIFFSVYVLGGDVEGMILDILDEYEDYVGN